MEMMGIMVSMAEDLASIHLTAITVSIGIITVSAKKKELPGLISVSWVIACSCQESI